MPRSAYGSCKKERSPRLPGGLSPGGVNHEAGGVLTSGRVERVIRERFGYEGLRPGQREEIWAVEVLPAGGAALEETGEDPLGLYERAACDKERHKQFERSRVEMMRGYAELGDCRRGYVLNYFGEGFEEPCAGAATTARPGPSWWRTRRTNPSPWQPRGAQEVGGGHRPTLRRRGEDDRALRRGWVQDDDGRPRRVARAPRRSRPGPGERRGPVSLGGDHRTEELRWTDRV